MKLLKNDRGVALLLVLVLSAVGLIIAMALAYMITESTKMSGMTKRFKSAFEAGEAGARIAVQLIDARGNPAIPLPNFVIPNTARLFDPNTGKLFATTSLWSAGTSTSTIIDANDAATYDFRFDIGVGPVYRVYVKIVDTIRGNTAPSPGGKNLHKHGVVANAGSSELVAAAYPFLYTVEILSQDSTNPLERARFNVLYQY